LAHGGCAYLDAARRGVGRVSFLVASLMGGLMVGLVLRALGIVLGLMR
jgi:hypothetical protein